MSTPIPLDAQRSVTRPPTRLNLPVELVDLIIGHVCADDIVDQDGLKCLSLFSKCFTPACQRVLFKAVTLQPAKFVRDDQEQTGPDTQFRFAAVIGESPHLGAFVKKLVYRFPAGPHEQRADIAYPKLASALSKLTNATEVHLEVSEGDKSPWGGRKIGHWMVFESTPKRRRGLGGVDAQLWKIMERPTMKVLGLHNIEIFAEQIVRCRGVEKLQLNNVIIGRPLTTNRRPNNKVGKDAPVYLKNFSYQGRYGLNEHRLNFPGDKYRNDHYLNVQWNVLETLSLPIEARHWDHSYLPSAIMSATPCLRELNMHTMSPFPPGQGDSAGTIPHLSPIRGLHRDSWLTLTRIRFDIGYDVRYGQEDEKINDPYHGLLLDGWFAKLVNLEELKVRVLIEGSKWRSMVHGNFGPQWGKLDEALVPKGKESPYQNLRKVQLWVGIDGICDEEDAQRHRPVMQKMFDTNFNGLRRLGREGRIELLLEVANEIDEESWKEIEERKSQKQIRLEKRRNEVKEERSDSGLDNRGEEDEEDEDEGEEVDGPEEDKE